MPRYDYACADCEKIAVKRLKRDLTSEEYDEMVLFETSHSMNPTTKELLEATICPRCNGTNCQRSLKNSNITSYILGNGYLDKDGARRDMNVFHLTQDDPYAEYRQPGEVDEMKAKLKRAGKHDPNRKHFSVSDSEMKQAVEDSVLNKPKPEKPSKPKSNKPKSN